MSGYVYGKASAIPPELERERAAAIRQLRDIEWQIQAKRSELAAIRARTAYLRDHGPAHPGNGGMGSETLWQMAEEERQKALRRYPEPDYVGARRLREADEDAGKYRAQRKRARK